MIPFNGVSADALKAGAKFLYFTEWLKFDVALGKLRKTSRKEKEFIQAYWNNILSMVREPVTENTGSIDRTIEIEGEEEDHQGKAFGWGSLSGVRDVCTYMKDKRTSKLKHLSQM